MAIKSDERITKLFHGYIRNKKILIADPNSTSRSTIAQGLINLGAMQNHMDLCANYDLAQEEIKRTKHDVVICDYDLGTRCGLELLQTQRESVVEMSKSLFILVTANASQSAIAQAAEEDVDTYIIKPFSSLTLRQSILTAASEKLFPNAYRKKIEEGKKWLLVDKIELALIAFEEAMELDESPTLACFYHGQANMVKDLFELAEGDYNQGLTYNRIHYKCLVGLFELFMAKKKFQDAYNIVRKIARYFPANPNRLGQVVRLAIMTENYQDIEGYYQTFIGLDHRNAQLIRYICAGLVICGRFYLQKKQFPRALELFQKAGVTGTSDPKILKEIVCSLIEYQLHDKAKDFLKRFPSKTDEDADFVISQFLVEEAEMPIHQSIDIGQKLLKKGITDPALYRTLIINTSKASMNSACERLLEEGSAKYPSYKGEFLNCKELKKAKLQA